MESIQSLSYELHFPDEDENHFYESDHEPKRPSKKKKTVSTNLY